jgi:hypothetical protein
MSESAELIGQAIADIEALQFRLWREVDKDDPSLVDGVALGHAYIHLDTAASMLQMALTGRPKP